MDAPFSDLVNKKLQDDYQGASTHADRRTIQPTSM